VKTVNVQISKLPIDLTRRGSGLLLHVTSLPGRYGIGDLGPEAIRWVNLLAKAGQRWWQMLPLGPCGEGNSPYRCYSAFAGNPLLISPDRLFEDGLLSKADLRKAVLPSGKVDYQQVAKNKHHLLAIAFEHFRSGLVPRLSDSVERFLQAQISWLDDYSLFMAIRNSQKKHWTDWPMELRLRKPAALASARAELADAIEFHKFTQFLFFRQLDELRNHAAAAGVGLIGDLPIFVSPEPAVVWTNPKLFQLDRHGKPKFISGVPPDLFSATGQCWGNPLYNWNEMRRDGFSWWKSRLAAALSQADLVRIDHFRGFESYWSIPGNALTAESGKWVKAPGVELFDALLEGNPRLPLLAEDLGIITPEVEALRDRFNLPGMRVLQFGFGSEPGNPHTPCNFVPHCFAYTGTHDNDTTASWYRLLPAAGKRRLKAYAPGLDWETHPVEAMIRLLMSSTARQAIIPVQDLLGLGRDARMNTPGKAQHNWEWRLNDFKSCLKPLATLSEICNVYERRAN